MIVESCVKRRGQKVLVDNLANIACRSDKIRSYVLVTEEMDGTINVKRGGIASSQLGLTQVASNLISDTFDWESSDEDSDEDC